MARSRPVSDETEVRVRVSEYLAALPAGARRALRAVRATVRKAVPAATEHFSYGIPGFRIDGQPLVWYAAFKNHFSLYPMGTATRRAHAVALEGYETSKGTIRFPLSEPVPVALITKLVKARAAEARAGVRKQ
jgi:uncharacterized protein YdhG (YjbR/CyaY superfamily)